MLEQWHFPCPVWLSPFLQPYQQNAGLFFYPVRSYYMSSKSFVNEIFNVYWYSLYGFHLLVPSTGSSNKSFTLWFLYFPLAFELSWKRCFTSRILSVPSVISKL